MRYYILAVANVLNICLLVIYTKSTLMYKSSHFFIHGLGSVRSTFTIQTVQVNYCCSASGYNLLLKKIWFGVFESLFSKTLSTYTLKF